MPSQARLANSTTSSSVAAGVDAELLRWLRPPWAGRPIHGSVRLISLNNRLFAGLLRNQGAQSKGGQWHAQTQFIRMALLAMQRFGHVDRLDVVYATSDDIPIHKTSSSCGFPPVLANSQESDVSCAIAVPDYSWMGGGNLAAAGNPPWCEVMRSTQPKPWKQKIAKVLFAGDLYRGTFRNKLRTGWNGSATWPVPFHVIDSADPRQKRMSWSEQCDHQYLLSLPGAGDSYANRLKGLLLCGAVVIHIPSRSEEFFVEQLQHNVHYIRVPSLEAVGPELQRLVEAPERAVAMAKASRHFALHNLSWVNALRYTHSVLAQHAANHPRVGEWVEDPDSSSMGNMTAQGLMSIQSATDAARLLKQPPFGSNKCVGWNCARTRSNCTGE